MKILALQAENVKRLVAVEIHPSGNLVEITGKNGSGKQQPVSEPVLTPYGWRPIGEIKVGDFVIGSNGQPTRVMAVFPQTVRETYHVAMADGAWTRCGPEHLWTVSRWNEASGSKERITETLTTKAIMDIGVRRGASRRWALPVVAPIAFADQGYELPVDPYTLGVILGDGHIEPSGYVTVSSWDQEILDAVEVPDRYRTERELGTAFWSRPLRHMGLGGKRAWEKFIPEQYLWASIPARWALLHALLDTDGTTEDSWASFCSTSERLVDGVVQLASSLGCVAKKRKGTTKKYTYNGEAREGRMAWSVGIKSQEPPFRLARKKDAWSPSEQRGEWWRFIDTIERVADEDSVCIQVAAKDGLYVTRDFILTHNTSTLDAIWWALSGTSHIQASPIRKGEERARIRLDMGEVVVTRTFKAKDDGGVTTSLTVENAEGARFNSPQAMLDSLVGSLSFDPLAFTRMAPKQQFDLLKTFVPGVDFDAIEAANKADFQKRTDLNRRAKEARAAAGAIVLLPQVGALPSSRVNLDAIEEELASVGEKAKAFVAEAARRDHLKSGAQALEKSAGDLRDRAVRLRQEAEEADRQAEAAEKKADSIWDELRGLPALESPPDTETLRQRLATARAVNLDFDRRDQRTAHEERARALEAEAAALTRAMEQRQQAKESAVAAAEMPVSGLSFGDGEILLNGVPFNQGSDAQQLRASVAIAMALNPKLRVIRVRDGSLLDEEGMKLLADLADQHDCQVWAEVVNSPRTTAIRIEDGMTASQPLAAE